MSTTVVGLYDSEEAARRAVDALNDAGFEDDRIRVEAHGAHERSGKRDRDLDRDLAKTLEREGVPRDDAHFYAEGVRRGGSLIILETDDKRADRAVDVMNVHEPVHREVREAAWRERGYTGYDPTRESYSSEEVEAERARYRTGETSRETSTRTDEGEGEEEVHMSEAREEVRVGKRRVESGGARIHKRVTERPVEETVELHDETVEVEKRPAARGQKASEDVFKEETIEMRETREEPVVEKETHITGEVVARKKGQTRRETIHETVRETEIDIDTPDDFGEYEPMFREHYDETFGGGDFSTYRPAYRHGYSFGSSSKYRDRDFSAVEPEIRSTYEKDSGSGTFEDVKEAVRYGFQRARTKTRR